MLEIVCISMIFDLLETHQSRDRLVEMSFGRLNKITATRYIRTATARNWIAQAPEDGFRDSAASGDLYALTDVGRDLSVRLTNASSQDLLSSVLAKSGVAHKLVDRKIITKAAVFDCEREISFSPSGLTTGLTLGNVDMFPELTALEMLALAFQHETTTVQTKDTFDVSNDARALSFSMENEHIKSLRF